MIEGISKGVFTGFGQSVNRNKENNIRIISGDSAVSKYADSFVRHTVESAPALFGLSVLWSVCEKSASYPFKKAMWNNLKNYFAPVLLATSVILTTIENIPNKKSKNK